MGTIAIRPVMVCFLFAPNVKHRTPQIGNKPYNLTDRMAIVPIDAKVTQAQRQSWPHRTVNPIPRQIYCGASQTC